MSCKLRVVMPSGDVLIADDVEYESLEDRRNMTGHIGGRPVYVNSEDWFDEFNIMAFSITRLMSMSDGWSAEVYYVDTGESVNGCTIFAEGESCDDYDTRYFADVIRQWAEEDFEPPITLEHIVHASAELIKNMRGTYDDIAFAEIKKAIVKAVKSVT